MVFLVKTIYWLIRDRSGPQIKEKWLSIKNLALDIRNNPLIILKQWVLKLIVGFILVFSFRYFYFFGVSVWLNQQFDHIGFFSKTFEIFNYYIYNKMVRYKNILSWFIDLSVIMYNAILTGYSSLVAVTNNNSDQSVPVADLIKLGGVAIGVACGLYLLYYGLNKYFGEDKEDEPTNKNNKKSDDEDLTKQLEEKKPEVVKPDGDPKDVDARVNDSNFFPFPIIKKTKQLEEKKPEVVKPDTSDIGTQTDDNSELSPLLSEKPIKVVPLEEKKPEVVKPDTSDIGTQANIVLDKNVSNFGPTLGNYEADGHYIGQAGRLMNCINKNLGECLQNSKTFTNLVADHGEQFIELRSVSENVYKSPVNRITYATRIENINRALVKDIVSRDKDGVLFINGKFIKNTELSEKQTNYLLKIIDSIIRDCESPTDIFINAAKRFAILKIITDPDENSGTNIYCFNKHNLPELKK